MIQPMLVGDRALRAALPVTALAAAEVGHWLVFQARFAAAPEPASVQAVHGYFPTLLSVTTALIGAGVLAVLLLSGAARAAAGRRDGRRVVQRPALIDLWAALFVLQLAIFGIQELAEGVAAGRTLSPAELLLWGGFGQLPASLLAAILLRWAATEFEAALIQLRTGVAEVTAHVVPLSTLPRPRVAPRRLLAQIAGPSLHGRGPPALAASV